MILFIVTAFVCFSCLSVELLHAAHGIHDQLIGLVKALLTALDQLGDAAGTTLHDIGMGWFEMV